MQKKYWRFDTVTGAYIGHEYSDGFFKEVPRMETVTELDENGEEIQVEREVFDLVPYMPDDITDIPIPQPMYDIYFDREQQIWVETGSPPEPDIEALRSAAIVQTKAWVDGKLSKGMIYTDGKTYNVTREKRADLAGVILVGKMNEEQGVPDEQNILRWNVSGEVHEDWLYKDLCALAYTMYKYVTPIIEKQQHAEIMIKEAETVDEINEILKNFA